MDAEKALGLARWNRVAARINDILNEPEADTAKREAWLIKYVHGGGDITHVAAGASLAAAILTVAVLSAPEELIRRLLYNPQPAQGRECFRYDFARCLLIRFNHTVLHDDLACPICSLAKSSDEQVLCDLLHALSYESGELIEQISSSAP